MVDCLRNYPIQIHTNKEMKVGQVNVFYFYNFLLRKHKNPISICQIVTSIGNINKHAKK